MPAKSKKLPRTVEALLLILAALIPLAIALALVHWFG